MQTRHPLLFDVERWRSHRVFLLGPATVGLMVCVLTLATRRDQAAQVVPFYGGLAVVGYLGALVYWLPVRLRWIAVDGPAIVVHSARRGHSVPLDRVRRARLTRLGGIFDRPERRRLLPGRGRKLLTRDTVVVRLDREDVADLVAVRRVLGRACVIGEDLVLAVPDCGALLAAIDRRRPAAPSAATRRGRRRGR